MSVTLAALLVFLATCAGLRALLASGLAHRLAIDEPNARSLHVVPTPRVGGLVLIPAALAGWLAASPALLPLAALADREPSPDGLTHRAIDALDDVARFDAALAPVVDELRSAQAQIDDAVHTLNGYLGRAEPDPARLAELDARLSAWVSLARRHKRAPAELPALLQG